MTRPTRRVAGIWHGYPELGSRIPTAVLEACQQGGRLDEAVRRRLRRLRRLEQGFESRCSA